MSEPTPEMIEAGATFLNECGSGKSGDIAEGIYNAMKAVEPDGWEPIETAPKDGAEFLAMLSNGWYSLLRARSTDRYSYWVGSGEAPPIVETHPADTDWDKNYTILATHWRPLPPLSEGV
jgi:hypothetical protein